jgi:hypothetical protein
MLSGGAFGKTVYAGDMGQLSGGNEGSSSISCGDICNGEREGGTKFEERIDRYDVCDTVDMGRGVLGWGRSTEKWGMGGVYIPGSVLVVTSVSAVLLRSTTPLRLGGSFALSTTIGCLVCTLLEGWDCAKLLVSVWLSCWLVLRKGE